MRRANPDRPEPEHLLLCRCQFMLDDKGKPTERGEVIDNVSVEFSGSTAELFQGSREPFLRLHVWSLSIKETGISISGYVGDGGRMDSRELWLQFQGVAPRLPRVVKPSITRGSGNVFADLGLPNPEEREKKAEIAIRIEQRIKAQGWDDVQAAQHMKITPEDVADIVRAGWALYDLHTLNELLARAEQETT